MSVKNRVTADRPARVLDVEGDVGEYLQRHVMDGLVAIFPQAENIVLVLHPAPGMDAIVIPIAGKVPGIVGHNDWTYTG